MGTVTELSAQTPFQESAASPSVHMDRAATCDSVAPRHSQSWLSRSGQRILDCKCVKARAVGTPLLLGWGFLVCVCPSLFFHV